VSNRGHQTFAGTICWTEGSGGLISRIPLFPRAKGRATVNRSPSGSGGFARDRPTTRRASPALRGAPSSIRVNGPSVFPACPATRVIDANGRPACRTGAPAYKAWAGRRCLLAQGNPRVPSNLRARVGTRNGRGWAARPTSNLASIRDRAYVTRGLCLAEYGNQFHARNEPELRIGNARDRPN